MGGHSTQIDLLRQGQFSKKFILCAYLPLTAVNELILARLQSDVSLINQLGFYIVSAGGKRMRPMLTVMAARALGYEGEDHLKLAAIIEFIHTSTLLHDDVVDGSAAADELQRSGYHGRELHDGHLLQDRQAV